MSEVSAFNRKALEGKSNRDWLSNYTSSGGSSVGQLYSQAKAENAATADEVDRSGDSGTSTVEKITAWATLGMSLATTGLQIYQTLSGKGGSGSGSGSGAGSGSGSGAGSAGGDPLTALTSATNAYQASQTKQNLQVLTQAISTASSIRDGLKQGIDAKEKALNSYQSMLVKQGDQLTTNYEKCETYLTGLQGEITSNLNVIETQNQTISANQDFIKACEEGNKQKAAQLSQNQQAQAAQQTVVAEQEGAVGNAAQTETQATTAQNKAQSEQDQYIADYSAAKSNESVLKTTWDSTKSALDKASSDINAKKGKVSGLEQQIKTDKKAKKDVSGLESQLSAAKKDLKDAETKLKEAEKAEKEAKKAYEENQKEIKNLESKIKFGEKTLAQLKSEVTEAEKAKATAEQSLSAACNELKGFIKEEEIISADVVALADKEAGATQKDLILNTALAKAITNDKTLLKNKFNATEAATTIQNHINEINTALGKADDPKSDRGKLEAYNKAIAKAEAVRNMDFSDIQTGGEAFKASQDGYKGIVPEGATGYTKLPNGDFQFTMSDGTKQTFNAEGNASGTPLKGSTTPTGTETTPPKGGVPETPLVLKPEEDSTGGSRSDGTGIPTWESAANPTPTDGTWMSPVGNKSPEYQQVEQLALTRDGFSGTVPEGSTEYKKDGDVFIFKVGDKEVKVDKDGKEIK